MRPSNQCPSRRGEGHLVILGRAFGGRWVRMRREIGRGHGTDMNETVHGIPETGVSVIVGKLVRTSRVFVLCRRAVHVGPTVHPQNYPPEMFLPVFLLGGNNFSVQLGSVPYCTRVSLEILPPK